MISSSFFRNPATRAELDLPVSAARLAAEALFAGSRLQPTDGLPAPQVIVKRKRALETAQPTTGKHEDQGGAEVRTPKVHVLRPAVRPASADAATPAQLPGQPAQPRHKRPSRTLSGKVTIIRLLPEAANLPARSTASESPATSLPRELRYPRLVAQIHALEHQARMLQKREQTIRWVRDAIALYELTERELGL